MPGLVADRRVAPAELPAGMLGADAPAVELNRQGAGVERIERRHAVDDDKPMHIELQLHQQLVAECLNEIGGIRSAAHMPDRDLAMRRGAQRGFTRLGIEARQLVLDRPQGFEHLAGQKILGPPLRLGNRHHARGTGAEPVPFRSRGRSPPLDLRCYAAARIAARFTSLPTKGS